MNYAKKFDFGLAVCALKAGKLVAREGWNGKGMWLRLVKNGSYDVACGVIYPTGTWEEGQSPISLDPWIGMKTAGDTFVPWLASQADILATDWSIV